MEVFKPYVEECKKAKGFQSVVARIVLDNYTEDEGKKYLEQIVSQYDDDSVVGDRIWGFSLIFRIKTILNLVSCEKK